MKMLAAASVAIAALVGTQGFAAPVNGTGDLTSDVIYGSGNADGSFTGVTVNGLELALRAKLRYPASNIFNYDGIDTYTFVNGANPVDRSVFNFDFSVNTDVSDLDGTPSATISGYSYLLSVDNNPTTGTNFVTIDPLLIPDNSLGFNSTANGGGVETGEYSIYSVLQNSHNLGFGYSADPDAEGMFTISLAAFDANQTEVARTSINVIVGNVPAVPLPAALPLLLGSICGLGFVRRFRRS